jgi:hypothetical protein
MRRPRGAFVLPTDGSGLGRSWSGRFTDILTGKGPDMFIGRCRDTRVAGEDWAGYPSWTSPESYGKLGSISLPHTGRARRPDLYHLDWKRQGLQDSFHNPWSPVKRYDPTTRRYENWKWDVLDGPRNNGRRPFERRWCHDPSNPWLPGCWQ